MPTLAEREMLPRAAAIEERGGAQDAVPHPESALLPYRYALFAPLGEHLIRGAMAVPFAYVLRKAQLERLESREAVVKNEESGDGDDAGSTTHEQQQSSAPPHPGLDWHWPGCSLSICRTGVVSFFDRRFCSSPLCQRRAQTEHFFDSWSNS